MDHPFFSDRYVLGKLVAEPTKQFCTVNYFTSRNGFEDTPKRRKLEAVKSILHPEADFGSIHEEIRRIESERDAEIKRITEASKRAIFGLCFQPEDA